MSWFEKENRWYYWSLSVIQIFYFITKVIKIATGTSFGVLFVRGLHEKIARVWHDYCTSLFWVYRVNWQWFTLAGPRRFLGCPRELFGRSSALSWHKSIHRQLHEVQRVFPAFLKSVTASRLESLLDVDSTLSSLIDDLMSLTFSSLLLTLLHVLADDSKLPRFPPCCSIDVFIQSEVLLQPFCIHGCSRICSSVGLLEGLIESIHRIKSWSSQDTRRLNASSARHISSSCSNGISPHAMSYRRIPSDQTAPERPW